MRNPKPHPRGTIVGRTEGGRVCGRANGYGGVLVVDEPPPLSRQEAMGLLADALFVIVFGPVGPIEPDPLTWPIQ